MDRRLAKSPALKSPVLSPKTPALYEKYKSGCAWGLIHFFDFRHNHSHGKLISDKKLPNRQAKGDGYTRNRPNFLCNEKKDQYKYHDALDRKKLAVNSQAKKVTEEGMSSVKHHTKENPAIAGTQDLPFNPKLVGPSKECRKTSISSQKSFPFLACGCDTAAEAYRQPSENRNKLVSAIEASGSDVHIGNGENRSCKSIRGRKQDHYTEINLRVHMNEVVEAFVNQKLTDGENLSGNEVENQSKNFIDALEVLNSNRELFMSLLQDPNSLLVKHIQNLRDSQVKKQPQSSSKAKTSECKEEATGEYEGPANAEGSDMPQPLNTIVVLKAGIQNCPDRISNWPSPQSQFSLTRKERMIRPAFLSFEHMKRKLRHAMKANRKDHGQMFVGGNHNSPHDDFEKFEDWRKEISQITKQANERIYASKKSESSHEINRIDGTCQEESFGSGIGSKEASSTEGNFHRTSNPPSVGHLKGKLHPRKNLSDMLLGGNYIEDFSRKPTLSTLDRLMSSPEYDLLPTLNHSRKKEHDFSSHQMRFSPYSNLPTAYNGYEWRVQKEKKSSCLSSSLGTNLGAQPVMNNEKPDDCLQCSKNRISVHGEDLIQKVDQTSAYPREVKERNHDVPDEHESNALELSLESNSVQNTDTSQRTEAFNIFGEKEYFESLKLDSPSGDRTSSSSSIDVYSISSASRAQTRAEDSDSMIDDRVEQPSPISVLEQFFVEDNTSSPGTESLAAEPSVEPFGIDIEELYASAPVESRLDMKSNNGCASMDKQGSLSEVMRAVLLQISGLNWDKLSRKPHSLDQTLDASMFDINVEVWLEKSSTDRRLLFGYINEVLSEMHRCYSSCSPWVAVLNPRPHQLGLLSENRVHNEVLKHVDWSLLSEIPQQTLQQIVEKDLAKSGTLWMDIRHDTDEAVTELVNIILEDLVVDAAIWLQT